MATGKDQGQPQQGATPGKASMLGNNMRAVRDVLGLVRPWQWVVVIGGLFLSSLFELFGLDDDRAAAGQRRQLRPGQARAGDRPARRPWRALGLPFHPATFLTLIVVGLSLKAVTASPSCATSAGWSPRSGGRRSSG